MIFYTKLWQLLNERKMKKTDLLKVISSPTLAKLGKNEVVTTEIIGKLCDFLECQPSDIMENITKKDVEKAEEILSDALEQIVNQIAAQTSVSKDTIREQLLRQGQAFEDKIIELEKIAEESDN